MTENKYEISVSDLTLEYPPHDGARAHTAVHGVSFNLAPGAVLALLGESGSGKHPRKNPRGPRPRRTEQV